MVLENLIGLTSGMCGYTFEIQLLLLGQFVLHLVLWSLRNSRKYQLIVAFASPIAIMAISGCMNMVAISSIILGVIFVVFFRFLNFSYISKNK